IATARHGHCAVALGSKILVIGGYTDEGPTSIVEEYDTEQDRWTRRAPMPTPRGFLGAGAVAGKVYAVGGRVGGQRVGHAKRLVSVRGKIGRNEDLVNRVHG